MTFEEYQEISKKTAIYKEKAPYPSAENSFVYPVLGLSGEVGEVAEKAKKILRDKGGRVSDEDKEELLKELGDVLWYLSQTATEFDLSLEEVARLNIEKLQSRKDRGKISGSGDNR